LEIAKFPAVTFKGVATLHVPSSFPSTQHFEVKGELDFHGQKRMETVPVDMTFVSATETQVKGTFPVSLDAYQVERPSLLLVKIEDTCQVTLDLTLAAEKK
jgi:hypothetical protein